MEEQVEDNIIDVEHLQREQLARKLSETLVALKNEPNLDVPATVKALGNDLLMFIPDTGGLDDFFWTPTRLSEMVIEYVQERIKNKGLPGFDTGMEKLNDMLGGWEKQNIYTLNASPGAGKTTAMLQWLWYLANQTPVVLFSPEARAKMLGRRLVSALSHVPGKQIRRGDIDDNQLILLQRGAKQMKSRPLFIIDLPEINARHMDRYLRQVEKRIGKKVGAIGVDYLQQMEGEDSFQIITNNMKDLETFIVKNDLACILASQVGRASRDDGDKQSAGKGSGKIEELSSVVMGFVAVEKKGDDYPDPQDKYRRWLVCSKNREEGEHFRLGLRYDQITGWLVEEDFVG